MKCDKAQNIIMLYPGRPIKPLKSLALHRHLMKCNDCRTVFLILGSSPETDLPIKADLPATPDFSAAVMERVYAMPPYKPGQKGQKKHFGYLRLMGCFYALMMGFLALYSADWGTNLLAQFDILANPADAGYQMVFFTSLADAGYQMIFNAVGALFPAVNLLLAVGLILMASLVYTLRKEQA